MSFYSKSHKSYIRYIPGFIHINYTSIHMSSGVIQMSRSQQYIVSTLPPQTVWKNWCAEHKVTSSYDMSNFKQQRRYARNLLLNTKEEFLKNQIELNRDNPRAFLRKLNKIIGNSKNAHNFTCIFNNDGVNFEKTEATEFMNDYFSQIGESLNANNHSAWSSHEYFCKITPRNVFFTKCG